MSITTVFFAVAIGSLLATGILWPWFEDTKNDPWQD